MKFNRPTLEEAELAFSKLQAYNYFDNYDLILRKKIAEYKGRAIDQRLDKFIAEFSKAKPFDKLLKDGVNIITLPKSVKSENGLPHNFYTNARVIDGNEIEKAFVVCDLPIEFHLIATIWILRYGAYLESKISKNSYGNRLILDKGKQEIVEGRSLFRPYFKQFQKWWSKAVKETKKLLSEGENVTIVNFDLQSFYHNVQFDFNELEIVLKAKFPFMDKDPVHRMLVSIHGEYRKKILELNVRLKNSLTDNKYPLPIGVFTSHLLANWYLLKLDKYIEKNIRPVYYGRYVDDILMVVKDTIYEKSDIGSDGESKAFVIKKYLKEYFDKLFSVQEEQSSGGEASPSGNITLNVSGLENLVLNEEKLFVYQFDANYSPNLVETFVEEQKERASMFKFLSDEEDEYFEDFDAQTFESNFDHIETNKARFKNLQDNKYKLSVFFSKLIKRRIQKGEGYREEDVDKISKYFRGAYLIKNYFFWEKLLTLYVVYKRPDKLIDLIKEIHLEIKGVKFVANEAADFMIDSQQYRESLRRHFDSALRLSLGLNLAFLFSNKGLQNLIIKVVYYNSLTRGGSMEDKKRLEKDFSLFKITGLLRGAFVYYPLLQFANISRSEMIDFTDWRSFNYVLEINKSRKKHTQRLDLSLSLDNYKKFIPFRVKFWQVALLVYQNNFLLKRSGVTQNSNLWHTDGFASHEILNDAFDLFYEINNPKTDKETLRKFFYDQELSNDAEKKYPDTEIRIPSPRSRNYYSQALYFNNGGPARDKFRVCMVNKYVGLADFEASLKGAPLRSPEKVEIFERIWDGVAGVPDCDLFVMPELALPHSLVSAYVDQSARKQTAFISGVEHMNVFNTGFNFILTVLPVNINGDKDAVPVFRLKNHYAPEEEEWIRENRIEVPKPNPYRYDLFAWRGVYFSSYYCFELADVFHRSIYFSKVDVIFAPVWNPDTHYYNSIIDAATRDMHNYFVIVNTSQFGFSKISRPRDFVNKEKVILKGGTDDNYPFTLAVGDLKIKELREFQRLSYSGQKKLNGNKKSFKPTPPDFPLENIITRINNAKFSEE